MLLSLDLIVQAVVKTASNICYCGKGAPSILLLFHTRVYCCGSEIETALRCCCCCHCSRLTFSPSFRHKRITWNAWPIRKRPCPTGRRPVSPLMRWSSRTSCCARESEFTENSTKESLWVRVVFVISYCDSQTREIPSLFCRRSCSIFRMSSFILFTLPFESFDALKRFCWGFRLHVQRLHRRSCSWSRCLLRDGERAALFEAELSRSQTRVAVACTVDYGDLKQSNTIYGTWNDQRQVELVKPTGDGDVEVIYFLFSRTCLSYVDNSYENFRKNPYVWASSFVKGRCRL